jgi:branched-chain amino acid transport system permease protein
VVENYAAGLFGGDWKDFTGFVLLVVLLMFRPTGLLGESLGRARA